MNSESSRTELQIILYLNRREAEWLKDVMQNPLTTIYVRESTEDKNMRETFFNNLSHHLKG